MAGRVVVCVPYMKWEGWVRVGDRCLLRLVLSCQRSHAFHCSHFPSVLAIVPHPLRDRQASEAGPCRRQEAGLSDCVLW
jgi:hypothetical protein